MAYPIDPRKVAAIVTECNRVMQGHKFSHGEVIIGLSELLGRVIVDAAKNHIQTDEMYQIVQGHIRDTIKVGNSATGKSLIERV